MTVGAIKADFAIKAVATQQGLVVSQDKVDDEVMTLQAQTLQRGEKFRESEVRPRVQASLEKQMVLDWLQTHATVSIVDPKSEDEKVEEILGQSPEELAKSLADDEEVIAARDAAETSAEATRRRRQTRQRRLLRRLRMGLSGERRSEADAVRENRGAEARRGGPRLACFCEWARACVRIWLWWPQRVSDMARNCACGLWFHGESSGSAGGLLDTRIGAATLLRLRCDH